MYLPITTSFPLFAGGMIALFVHRQLHHKPGTTEKKSVRMRMGMLIACGLVAGAALMDVVLAFAFSMLHGPDGLSLVGQQWETTGVCLGILSMVCLGVWMKRRICA